MNQAYKHSSLIPLTMYESHGEKIINKFLILASKHLMPSNYVVINAKFNIYMRLKKLQVIQLQGTTNTRRGFTSMATPEPRSVFPFDPTPEIRFSSPAPVIESFSVGEWYKEERLHRRRKKIEIRTVKAKQQSNRMRQISPFNSLCTIQFPVPGGSSQRKHFQLGRNVIFFFLLFNQDCRVEVYSLSDSLLFSLILHFT